MELSCKLASWDFFLDFNLDFLWTIKIEFYFSSLLGFQLTMVDECYIINKEQITRMKKHIFSGDHNITCTNNMGRRCGIGIINPNWQSGSLQATRLSDTMHQEVSSKLEYINIYKNVVIDQYIFNQYINNSDIINQFNNYIDLCLNVKDNESHKYHNAQKLKNMINNNLVDLLSDIIYFELNKYIMNTFNTNEYLIFNFSIEQYIHDLKENYINLIYTDKLKGPKNKIQMFGSGYFIDCLFELGNNTNYSTNKIILTISIKGDLWYKVE